MPSVDLPAFETLLVEHREPGLFVTLNRPESRNALSARMWAEIDAVFAAVDGDRSVRAVVLRGAGGHFSAGGDLKERDRIRDEVQSPASLEARNRAGGEVLLRIDQAPQVVVAVVQGNTLGGGFGLACVADIVIADESATFRLPEVGLGIPPAQIAPYVVRRVGLARARRLALTAATVRAGEAHALGLVDFLCSSSEELERRTDAVLSDITRCGPNAIGIAKRVLQVASEGPSEAYVGFAAKEFAIAYGSEEGQEGAAAIRERRPPAWQRTRP